MNGWVGQQGIRREKYNNPGSEGAAKSATPDVEMLMTEFDIPTGSGSNYGTRTRFWFTPPATTKYRFYQSCDDTCVVRIGNSADIFNSEDLKTVLSSGSYYHYRGYWPDLTGSHGIRFRSEWVTLTQGK